MEIQRLLQGVSPRKLRGSDNIYAVQVFLVSEVSSQLGLSKPIAYTCILPHAITPHDTCQASYWITCVIVPKERMPSAARYSLPVPVEVPALAPAGASRVLAVPSCSVLALLHLRPTILHQNHRLRSPPLGVSLDTQMLV